MLKNLAVLILLIADWLTAAISWSAFYYLRKTTIEHQEFHVNDTFYLGVVLVPVAWILLYYLQGTYHDIKRLYRLKLFNLTFIATIIGSTLIFFILILDDIISDYQLYYKSYFMLLGIHFLTVFLLLVLDQFKLVMNWKDLLRMKKCSLLQSNKLIFLWL